MASGSYILTVNAGGETGVYPNLITICDGKPKILSIKETSLLAGLAEIVITGNSFKKGGATSFIYFGAAKVKGLTTDDGTVIRAVVPETLPAGTVKVQVQVGLYNYPNEVDVTITENTFPVPTITSTNSVELQAGDLLEITGTNYNTTGNTVRLVSNVYPKLNYTLVAVSESETVFRFSTSNMLKPNKLDLYMMSNGKETKYSVTIKVNMKPPFITEVSPLTLNAGETITVTRENFNVETLSMILINEGGHKITCIDSRYATIAASTDLAPGQYPLEIKIGGLSASGEPIF